jgi:hypothetical protein
VIGDKTGDKVNLSQIFVTCSARAWGGSYEAEPEAVHRAAVVGGGALEAADGEEERLGEQATVLQGVGAVGSTVSKNEKHRWRLFSSGNANQTLNAEYLIISFLASSDRPGKVMLKKCSASVFPDLPEYAAFCIISKQPNESISIILMISLACSWLQP